MDKQSTTKDLVLVISTKVDYLIKKVDAHCIEAITVRDDTQRNKEAISWLKKGFWVVLGGLIISVSARMLAAYISK